MNQRMHANSITPDSIMQLGTAYCASKTLLSAVELGVFTELAHGALDSETLTQRLHLNPRGTQDFFDTLVALHMLERSNGRYANTAETDLFLDRDKPSYVGGMLELANTHLYPDWGSLTQALRTGEPQSEIPDNGDFYTAIYADSARLENFLQAMTGINLVTATAMAQKFPWDEYRSFADVGTAQGVLPVQVATAYPHLAGIGFDLPPVKPVFEKYIDMHGLAERVRFHAGDFFRDPLPNADVLVLGHVLHNWNLEQRQVLLGKAYQALTDEGALIVYESLIDDERKHNVPGLLFSLTMLLETPGGSDFTGSDCTSWMQAAGFRDVHVEHLVGPESMVIGIK